MKYSSLVIAASLALSPTLSLAQVDPLAANDGTTQRTGQTTLDRPVSSSSGVQLSTSQNTATAAVKASWATPLGLFNFSTVTASVPITSGATAVDISTLDTMASGASLGLSMTGIYVKPNLPTPQNIDALKMRIRNMCTQVWRQYDYENKYEPGDQKYVSPTVDCNLSDIAKLKDQQEVLENYEEIYFSGPVYFWGLNSKIGYQQYNFYDPTSLAQETLKGAPWSVGGYVAFQPDVAANNLISLSYQHQYGFNPAKSKIKCPPNSTGGMGCVNGEIGPPPVQIKDLFTVDYRMKPASFLAFDITPSYDVRAGVWAINIPVYFMGDGKNSLSGGLAFGWRSDKHVSTVGVFLSKPFSFGPSG